MHSVRPTYRELAAAIRAGAYPRECIWIDFKRRPYPEGAEAATVPLEKVRQELARDMASMAELSGSSCTAWRRTRPSTPSPWMRCRPVGLHETVDVVARDRITPPLAAVPTLVTNPENTATGFLVVEIPESPDCPHMTTSPIGAGQRRARCG
jgi:hypothetical protein